MSSVKVDLQSNAEVGASEDELVRIKAHGKSKPVSFEIIMSYELQVKYKGKYWKKWVMGLNTTFNNISVISWRSILLVEETGVPGENHRSAASH